MSVVSTRIVASTPFDRTVPLRSARALTAQTWFEAALDDSTSSLVVGSNTRPSAMKEIASTPIVSPLAPSSGADLNVQIDPVDRSTPARVDRDQCCGIVRPHLDVRDHDRRFDRGINQVARIA